MSSKKYDVVLFGASSFAGRMAARYLLDCKDASRTRWAAAGRNESKVRQVLQDLGAKDVPTIVADSHDEHAITEMCRQTRCVISTVGPYTHYGTTLVDVASREGVHYADLTGELLWSYDMQNQFDDVARRNKSIIIHSSGFDSVPSDLGTILAVSKLQQATKSPCGMVMSGVKAGGGVGGGTMLSALALIDQAAKDKKAQAVMADPYALSPIKGSQKVNLPLTFKDGSRVGCCYPMEIINAQVVRRTWGLLEQQERKNPGSEISYGQQFAYREYMRVPNTIVAGFASAMIYFFTAILSKVGLARQLAHKFASAKAGSGPSEEVMRNGFMNWQTTARSVDNKTFARATLIGRGDPGYTLTGIMLVESALAMVHDYDKLTDLAKQGGHLTPASVFGEKILTERLQASGKFDIKVELLERI